MTDVALPRRKLAVVFFNLGGPDDQDSVEPFLFNLFNDPAIIGLPGFIRTPLAGLISRKRAPEAKKNYAVMGGGSPLAPETRKQAEALEAELARARPDLESRVFIAMRYWRPFTRDAAEEVAAFAPDEIVLLPLYPQYSTTTSGSSLKEWRKVYKGPGRCRAVCCYPDDPGFVDGYARLIERTWEAAGGPENVRLLFSAHGLPEKVIRGGDPYQAQVEETAAAIVERLGPEWNDWQVCYQSRVGPLKWIGPSTVEAIASAASDGVGVLIVPLAFVSEHVETLVELDHEYKALAEELNCDPYLRVPAIGVEPAFVTGLASIVGVALERETGTKPGAAWGCKDWSKCPCRMEKAS